MVPFSQWAMAAPLIPRDAVPNTFGGWKCQSGGRVVDVWPGDLETLCRCPLNVYIWQPYLGARYVRQVDNDAAF